MKMKWIRVIGKKIASANQRKKYRPFCNRRPKLAITHHKPSLQIATPTPRSRTCSGYISDLWHLSIQARTRGQLPFLLPWVPWKITTCSPCFSRPRLRVQQGDGREMVVRVGAVYLQLSQPLVPHLPSLSPLKRGGLTCTHLGLRLLRSRSPKEAFQIRAFGSSHAFPTDDNEICKPQRLRKSYSSIDLDPPAWLDVPPVRPNWLQDMELVSGPRSVETTKKKKKRWEDGLKEAGGTAVKKAFSSMVFIIREVHSYTMLLRELLFYEDLKGVVDQVQRDMHASFCWLFQQIFSCTPTLMLSLMLLLANFTVHSMAQSFVAAPLPPVITTTSDIYVQQKHLPTPEAPVIKTTEIGGGGGGTKARLVAGANDDGQSSSKNGEVGSLEGTSLIASLEEEARAWRRVVEGAAQMEAEARHEVLMDREVLRMMVAPVRVEVETDKGYPEYFRTELVYRRAMEERPDDPLLLSNYAQFLFLVVHDHDRAEHYFKRAVGKRPADAEVLSRYANFLWIARKDLCAAEEMYLEAIEADPSNTSYAAHYAHFLWSTGGEDTCFPLDGTGEA